VVIAGLLGRTLTFANPLDLPSMVPREDLASSGYCLAKQRQRVPRLHSVGFYRVTLQRLYAWVMGWFGLTVTVDLSAASGLLAVEWFDRSTGRRSPRGRWKARRAECSRRLFPRCRALHPRHERRIGSSVPGNQRSIERGVAFGLEFLAVFLGRDATTAGGELRPNSGIVEELRATARGGSGRDAV
jgi:hypothetical protein